MERRQAEFLVKNRLPIDRIVRIGVIDAATADVVRGILAGSGVTLPVEVKSDWYFLGQ